MARKEPLYMEFSPMKAMFYAVTRGVEPLTDPKYDELRDFISLCTKENPDERPSTSQLLQVRHTCKYLQNSDIPKLQHPFILQNAGRGRPKIPDLFAQVKHMVSMIAIYA
mmetsp:Transcript_16915/g.21581  ORF Transcript_16915/g.21581 Transcript_16915/m.21581 type:complete len:110 (-) Transcript_16915:32-361(-)